MALNVISNYAANVSHRYLQNADAAATSSLAKLSSGSRVVSAKDDAASLAIGSRLNAEVQALKQASTNATQASSLLQIADGALSKIGDILTRAKVLAVQSGSGQLSSTERGILDGEYQQLLSEIDRISGNTLFNGVALLSGTDVTSTSLNGQVSSTNYVQAADGFQSIAFDATVTDTTTTTAVFTFSYDSSTNVLTAKNLTTGVSQGVDVGSAAIAVNATQTVKFNQLGTTVTLNSAFDKTADVAPSGASAFTSDSAGQIEASSIKLASIDAAAATALTSNAISVDASTGGVAASTLTVGSYTGSVDLTSTGTKTVTLSDGTNSFDVSFNVTTIFTTNDNAASFTVGELGTVAVGTNGTAATSFDFKVGSGVTANDKITVSVNQITTAALSLTGDITTAPNADLQSTAVSGAINTLNQARAGVGASQNRLQFAADNLATSIENQEAARSNLLDLDIAAEISVLTSKQILVQTGVSTLAQANSLPRDLLRLFQ
ncbi:MAG: flagellin [Alphaproteobacteria bacterium]